MLRRFLRAAPIALFVVPACSSGGEADPPKPPEPCIDAPNEDVKKVRFSPREVVVAPGESREVRVYIEPDICTTTQIPIRVEGASAKVEGTFDAGRGVSEARLKIVGVAPGSAKVTATFAASTATIDVDVRAKDVPGCGAPAKGNVAPGGTLKAAFNASLSIPAGAARDPESIDPLDEPSTVAPFDAEIACAASTIPEGYLALGPAITFGPVEKRFLREIPMEIPVNPALLPTAANLRHVRLQYSSNSLKTPRFVPVNNPRFELRGNAWVLRFDAPRLGTYQALVKKDAGTVKKKRRLTHRAVFGFSMGGIGSSMVGMNHHDLFDVVAPLGGPMDAGHFLDYALRYHFGGFCERKAGDPIPTAPCKADVGKPLDIFQHVQSYEDWWHMKGVDGTGGTFGRDQMVNIFRDVSAAWGDPAFTNTEHPHVAAGIKDPWPMRENGAADYCGNPDKATVAKTGFYDRRFNPDGKLPVIKVCDGASQPGFPGKWAPGGTRPLEMILAVDYNGNGQRDEGEPVIVQPYEPFEDVGKDGKASMNEPGYDPVTNPDPAGDDYDPQYNPLGTEGNHLHDEGEPFEDVGLDGVKCPSGETCAFDVGEGNGKFDMAIGLQNFFARDGRLQIIGHSKAPVGGPWDEKALDDLDYYSDGGIRDIFNWGTVGYHYVGGFVARNRPVAYYNDWQYLPNAKIANSDLFDPKEVDWSALPKAVYLKYGNIDATRRLIEKGDGQHVGYTDQVFRRVQTGLYYIGSRWPDADTRYAEDPPETDDPKPCGGTNTCTYDFTDSRGRSGPVTVILPPGYRASEFKDLRYPVVYFLHGYGQSPEDLKAFVLLVSPFMGQPLSSKATRLQKMIMVFVDGRCRGDAKDPECARGTFYVDSIKKGGPQMDKYFLELMKHVDATYRTMPTTEIEVVE